MPDLERDRRRRRSSARGCMFLNYPNNPTGAVVPDGLLRARWSTSRASTTSSSSTTTPTRSSTFDGYVAPSFLATPGAMDVGVEVFSLSKSYNMTGWRCGAIVGNADAIARYWRLKTNVDSGLFEAIQLAGAAALTGPQDSVARDVRALPAPPRPRARRAARDRHRRSSRRKGTIYVWAPVPEGQTSASFAEEVLERAAVVVSPGSAYGPNGEGFFRISLTVPDERLAEAVERMREPRLQAGSRLSPGWQRTKRHGRAKQSALRAAARRRRSSTRARASAPSASRCCRRAAARDGRDELAELKELLRTAGVAVAGELVQRRAAPGPERLPRQGQDRGAEGGDRRVGRQPDRLRRRAAAAPGAQPRAGARACR